jgi:hypothetical protein
MKSDVQKFGQKCPCFEGSDQSTFVEMWMISWLYNKIKLILSAFCSKMAQQLLLLQGKKRIYSSYANCIDSWFFF